MIKTLFSFAISLAPCLPLSGELILSISDSMEKRRAIQAAKHTTGLSMQQGEHATMFLINVNFLNFSYVLFGFSIFCSVKLLLRQIIESVF